MKARKSRALDSAAMHSRRSHPANKVLEYITYLKASAPMNRIVLFPDRGLFARVLAHSPSSNCWSSSRSSQSSLVSFYPRCRRCAKRPPTQCTNNLRQIALAQEAYAGQNRGFYAGSFEQLGLADAYPTDQKDGYTQLYPHPGRTRLHATGATDGPRKNRQRGYIDQREKGDRGGAINRG